MQGGWKIKEECGGGFFKSWLMSIRVELIASKATDQTGAALTTGCTELCPIHLLLLACTCSLGPLNEFNLHE